MLKAFLATGAKTAILFEDDVIFGKLDGLDGRLSHLPEHWDMVYLGANITDMVFGIKEQPPVPVDLTHNLFKIRRAWTTHAIIYTRKIADIIVRHYPVHLFNMYDNWLSENILPHYNCYLINPMVAFQRPGKSDLWGQETDYTGAFEWGNKFMAK